jgi:hypothetical protein
MWLQRSLSFLTDRGMATLQMGLRGGVGRRLEAIWELNYDTCAKASTEFARRETRVFECIGQGSILVMQLKADDASLTLCEVEVFSRFAGQ